MRAPPRYLEALLQFEESQFLAVVMMLIQTYILATIAL